MMKEKITIGLFIDTFYPMIDGVVSVVNNYAKRLIKYANVIVFAPEYPGAKYDDAKFPYKVIRCNSLKLPLLDYSLPTPKLDIDFLKELDKYHLDIVHIHSPFSLGNLGIHYAKKKGIPVIATMHSQFRKDFYRAVKSKKMADMMTRIIIKRFNECDECWAVNTEVARIFKEEYHYKTMPIVVNNATEMKPLKGEKKLFEEINQKYDIQKEDIVFLFVGRINALKNVFFVARSLKILKEKYHPFSFKMLFVGSGQDEEKLKEWIIKNQMQKEILLCGRVTNRRMLSAYYKRADLFLFPSLYDASSIVQIEAASQKTPCLFLEGAATTATITPERNGYVAPNDENAYANKIVQIFQDRNCYQEVQENCFHDLYKNWDDVVKKVYVQYLKLIRNNKFLII